MAMAGVTSQTFLGIRIACAQCHDHPFDVWKREDFYGLAAYFGRTRRYENQFTRTVYTTEMDQTTVLWPPEGVGKESDRKPMAPKFPFEIEKALAKRPTNGRQPVAEQQGIHYKKICHQPCEANEVFPGKIRNS